MQQLVGAIDLMTQILLLDYYHPRKMFILDRETLSISGAFRRDIPRGKIKDAGFAGVVKCKCGFIKSRKHFVAVFAEEGRHFFLIDGLIYDMSDESTTVIFEEKKHLFSVTRTFIVTKDGVTVFNCSYNYSDSYAQGWPDSDDLLNWIAGVAAGGKGFLAPELQNIKWDE